MAKSEEISNAVEQIIQTLNDETLEKTELQTELEKFLDYGVPLDQAQQTLIKKYGGTPAPTTTPGTAAELKISSIQPNQPSITLLARVLHIAPKEITVKGENKTIYYGILGDDTGTIPFTAWNDWQISKGDTIEIANAYSKEWQGNPQLNFGDRTSILKTEDDRLPEFQSEPQTVTVADLKAGMRNLEVTVKLLTANERTITTQNGEKTIISGTLADATGQVQYTSWHPHKELKEGATVNITNAYVKSWKGIPQFTFDESSSVTKEKDLKIKAEAAAQEMKLGELVDRGGGLSITTKGTILEVRPGSGIISRCPECNRALQNGECSIHGKVKGTPDLRLKLIIDDGSGAVNATTDQKTTENLLGNTLDQLKKAYKNKDDETMHQDLNNKLFGQPITITGNALTDEFGTTFIIHSAELLKTDVTKESEQLMQSLEDLL